MSIYQDIILDHYHAPRNFKKLKRVSNEVKVNNPLCGDMIYMQVETKNGVIHDIAFTGEGCAISKASASILTEYVKGKKIESVKKITSDEMIKLLGIELSPNRLKCALLSWEALIKVLK